VASINPFEKYAPQNGFIFPNFRGENKEYFELPAPSHGTVDGKQKSNKKTHLDGARTHGKSWGINYQPQLVNAGFPEPVSPSFIYLSMELMFKVSPRF